ncbi:cbb3-type cytochrome oxidase assembly protein CcoS [Massilia sp. CCM 8733]|uniref:Cbb3-type cytochrome oxidase assembly protein CcoS n=1 Tax=Massilia mucilaginosa TaxID=2609282 RepID=A0ABX0NL80_9BURK|nr:cbb3-type cytochrome oxidase assembly protein CcoS [Massilia mucilaginosa]NHZ87569.1 cbb3-type cytochrome oxidase assembly protein CcoS [Massilia mucilaginosa]
MESLYLLVPLSVFIVVLAAWVFFGAADSGQFDDLDGPGMRILLDDEESPAPSDTPPTSLRNDNE